MKNLETLRPQLGEFFRDNPTKKIRKQLNDVQTELFFSTAYQEWHHFDQSQTFSLFVNIVEILEKIEELTIKK